MRSLIPVCAVILVGFAAQAQSTGRLQGKVTDKDGKPIANAVITLKRTDITWKKEVKTNAQGTYIQIGLDPKLFDVDVEANGYVKKSIQLKISLGEKTEQDFTLLTPEQASGQQGAAQTDDPNVKATNDATSQYNSAAGLFNNKQYAEAKELLEKSIASMNEAVAKAKDDKAKEDASSRLAKMNKLYALCLFELGNEAKEGEERNAIYAKAEPIFNQLHQQDPKDTNYMIALGRIAEAKGDAANAKKFNDMVEAAVGPDPTRIYNQATDAFNKGDMAGAKAALLRLNQLDPKYPDCYYLLAMVEYGSSNLKATKAHLQKYLELAPTGSRANEIKAMLADPSLKNIK